MPNSSSSESKPRLSYLLPPERTEGELLDNLGMSYNPESGAQSPTTQSFFDTFDFRLYKKGLALTKEGSYYCLYRLNSDIPTDNDVPAAKTPCRSVKQLRFSRDLPEGEMKNELEPCMDVRALQPVTTVRKSTKTLRLLNPDEKTVLFLRLQHIEIDNHGKSEKLGLLINLIPVRGYEEEFRQVNEHIEKLGLRNIETDVLGVVLQKIGKNPEDYTSKLKVALDPSQSADEAFRRIFTHLLDTMSKNETGIVNDIDIEFLHDYRVAVRRARSLLSLIKGVLPEAATERVKNELRELGKLTNRLRDLDVYMLKKDEYTEILPDDLRAGLEPLFEVLKKDRQQSHSQIVKSLGMKSYKNKMSFLSGCMNEPGQSDDIKYNAGTPIIELATQSILKRYKKVIKHGKRITDQSPDPELHELRIDCKKLRYSLEFFSSLFPEDDIQLIVKHLKKLQDNLGDFNDLFVQQESLKKFLGEVQTRGSANTDTILSIGGLISALYQKQKAVRSEFSDTFREFHKKEYREQFRRLFQTPDILEP